MSWAALAPALRRRAAALALAHGEAALQARRRDPARWHRAAHLWPLFANPDTHGRG